MGNVPGEMSPACHRMNSCSRTVQSLHHPQSLLCRVLFPSQPKDQRSGYSVKAMEKVGSAGLHLHLPVSELQVMQPKLAGYSPTVSSKRSGQAKLHLFQHAVLERPTRACHRYARPVLAAQP